MKKTLISVVLVIVLWIFFLSGCQRKNDIEQDVYEKTLKTARDYVSLRYQTEELLINAEKYPDYKPWNEHMNDLIKNRQNMEKEAKELEKLATSMVDKSDLSILGIWKIYAYDRNEISNIFDKAPAWKKIATLAKHLWVDAKTAFKILKNDQAQVEADAWNEAWDTFQKLETSATVIKDGCKVAGYVWGIAVWWWVAALAGKSLLTQAAVIVWGADLVLEVTDDWAKIALGNHNKISSVVGDVRTITEPISNILTITDIPNNLGNGFEKFTAVMIALESFRWAAQEWKILWVELPVYEKTEKFANIKKYKAPVYVSVIDKKDVDTRLADTKKTSTKQEEKADIESLKELNDIINDHIKNNNNLEEVKQDKPNEKTNNDWLVWIWEWNVTRTSSESASPETKERVINFLEDGTVDSSMFEDRDYEDDEWDNDVVPTWTKEENIVRIYNADFGNNNNYFEFNLQWDTLIFIKLVWPDSEWNWGEWLAWSNFFWWKFFAGELEKMK